MSKTKIFTAATAIILVVALLCLALVGCSEAKPPVTEGGDETVAVGTGAGSPITTITNVAASNDEGELVVQTVKTEGVQLKFAPMAELKNGTAPVVEDAIATVVTAEVLPADAPNKAVEWSVGWAQGASRASEDVNAYVTVVPNEPGSNVATVYCHQSFYGDYIYVKVKTVVGGFSATARCTFIGAPETLTVEMGDMMLVNDEAWGVELYELECGQTYAFDLNLDNSIHQVGPDYGIYDITVDGFGSIMTLQKNCDKNAFVNSTTPGTKSLEAANDWATEKVAYTYMETADGEHVVLTFTINEEGQLVVTAGDAVEAYNWTTVKANGGFSECTFDKYGSNKIPYTSITIRDMASNLSTTINIRTVSSVGDVNISGDSLIVF